MPPQNISLIWTHDFSGLEVAELRIIYRGSGSWEEILSYNILQSSVTIRRAKDHGRLEFNYTSNNTTLQYNNIISNDAGVYGLVAFADDGYAFTSTTPSVQLTIGKLGDINSRICLR